MTPFLLQAQAQASALTGSGPGASTAGLPGVVLNIYNLALLFGGLLAFVMILYAAIKYTVQGGNPSAQSDAKDQITQAILGLALLLGAYIVLNTINPELADLKLPTLKKVEAPKEPLVTLPPGGGPTSTSAGGYGCNVLINGRPARFCGDSCDALRQQCAGQCQRIVNCAPQNTGSKCNSGAGCGVGGYTCVWVSTDSQGERFDCRQNAVNCNPSCQSNEACVKNLVGPPFCSKRDDG